jgi:hypothetical protein
MYLYVTSNINNGHKIGITDNLLKRKNQYNTIFPELKFLITIFSHEANFIEESFKERFFRYRKFSGNSDRRSEIYTLYFKIIAEHIIRCHHATGKVLLIPENTLEAEFYNTPYEGGTNYYLSNHYFIDYKKWTFVRNYGISERLLVGTIFQHQKEIEGKKVWGWLLKHLSFGGFRKSLKNIEKKSKERSTPVPVDEWEEFDSFGKPQDIFFHKYYDALNYLQEEIFLILLEEKIIKRPYDINIINKFKEIRGFTKNHLAYRHERIFWGKRIWGWDKKFNLGIGDEKRKAIKQDTHFPEELIKYGKGWDG